MNPRIEADTFPVLSTSYSHIRLMNDTRWPWFILLPVEANSATIDQRASSELHQLEQNLRNGFLSDVTALSDIVQQHTQCKSVNIAMLGNVVPDLHCHVIARDEGDLNWPNPVWGFEIAINYEGDFPQSLLDAIRAHFQP